MDRVDIDYMASQITWAIAEGISQGQEVQPRSFDGRTCGECAWICEGADSGLCRRVAWRDRWTTQDPLPIGNVYSDTPACPAFVPRKENSE